MECFIGRFRFTVESAPGLSGFLSFIREEYRTASNSLENCRYKVDYILTHNIPEKGFYELGYSPQYDDKELVGFLQWVYEKVEFKEWYAGHFHIDETVCGKVRILYNDILSLPTD